MPSQEGINGLAELPDLVFRIIFCKLEDPAALALTCRRAARTAQDRNAALAWFSVQSTLQQPQRPWQYTMITWRHLKGRTPGQLADWIEAYQRRRSRGAAKAARKSRASSIACSTSTPGARSSSTGSGRAASAPHAAGAAGERRGERSADPREPRGVTSSSGVQGAGGMTSSACSSWWRHLIMAMKRGESPPPPPLPVPPNLMDPAARATPAAMRDSIWRLLALCPHGDLLLLPYAAMGGHHNLVRMLCSMLPAQISLSVGHGKDVKRSIVQQWAAMAAVRSGHSLTQMTQLLRLGARASERHLLTLAVECGVDELRLLLDALPHLNDWRELEVYARPGLLRWAHHRSAALGNPKDFSPARSSCPTTPSLSTGDNNSTSATSRRSSSNGSHNSSNGSRSTRSSRSGRSSRSVHSSRRSYASRGSGSNGSRRGGGARRLGSGMVLTISSRADSPVGRSWWCSVLEVIQQAGWPPGRYLAWLLQVFTEAEGDDALRDSGVRQLLLGLAAECGQVELLLVTVAKKCLYRGNAVLLRGYVEGAVAVSPRAVTPQLLAACTVGILEGPHPDAPQTHCSPADVPKLLDVLLVAAEQQAERAEFVAALRGFPERSSSGAVCYEGGRWLRMLLQQPQVGRIGAVGRGDGESGGEGESPEDWQDFLRALIGSYGQQVAESAYSLLCAGECSAFVLERQEVELRQATACLRVQHAIWARDVGALAGALQQLADCVPRVAAAAFAAVAAADAGDTIMLAAALAFDLDDSSAALGRLAGLGSQGAPGSGSGSLAGRRSSGDSSAAATGLTHGAPAAAAVAAALHSAQVSVLHWLVREGRLVRGLQVLASAATVGWQVACGGPAVMNDYIKLAFEDAALVLWGARAHGGRVLRAQPPWAATRRAVRLVLCNTGPGQEDLFGELLTAWGTGPDVMQADDWRKVAPTLHWLAERARRGRLPPGARRAAAFVPAFLLAAGDTGNPDNLVSVATWLAHADWGVAGEDSEDDLYVGLDEGADEYESDDEYDEFFN